MMLTTRQSSARRNKNKCDKRIDSSNITTVIYVVRIIISFVTTTTVASYYHPSPPFIRTSANSVFNAISSTTTVTNSYLSIYCKRNAIQKTLSFYEKQYPYRTKQQGSVLLHMYNNDNNNKNQFILSQRYYFLSPKRRKSMGIKRMLLMTADDYNSYNLDEKTPQKRKQRDTYSLQEWAKDYGIQFHDGFKLTKLNTNSNSDDDNYDVDDENWGVSVSQNLKAGTIILSVPASIVLSSDQVLKELRQMNTSTNASLMQELESALTFLQEEGLTNQIPEFLLFVKLLLEYEKSNMKRILPASSSSATTSSNSELAEKETAINSVSNNSTFSSCSPASTSSRNDDTNSTILTRTTTAWDIWLQSLPRTFDTALYMEPVELDCLPPLGYVMANIELRHYDVFKDALLKLSLPSSLLNEVTIQNESFLQWAFSNVFTRSWGRRQQQQQQQKHKNNNNTVPTVIDTNGDNDVDSSRQLQQQQPKLSPLSYGSNAISDLVPLGDMFNHADPANVIVEYAFAPATTSDSTNDQNSNNNNDFRVQFVLKEDVTIGTPLHLSYGYTSNPYRFLVLFGFVDLNQSEIFCEILFEKDNEDNQKRQQFEKEPATANTRSNSNSRIASSSMSSNRTTTIATTDNGDDDDDRDYAFECLGCKDRSKMVFRTKDGAISTTVWDCVLYAILKEQVPDLANQFLKAHTSQNIQMKQFFHQKFHFVVCSTIYNHVNTTCTQLIALLEQIHSTKQEQQRNGTAAKSNKFSSRLSNIQKQNKFLLNTFQMVKLSLQELMSRKNDDDNEGSPAPSG